MSPSKERVDEIKSIIDLALKATFDFSGVRSEHLRDILLALSARDEKISRMTALLRDIMADSPLDSCYPGDEDLILRIKKELGHE